MLSLISVTQIIYLKFLEYYDQQNYSNKILYLENLRRPPINPYDKNKPYLIGITGGIASGKSTVRNELENMGYLTLDCDKLGHKTYEKDKNAYKKLIEIFGEDILDENKYIDRKILGKKVFNNQDELKKLTDIVWPEINNLMIEEANLLFQKFNQKVVFVEAALLIEANWHLSMNEVWVCSIPEKEVYILFFAIQRAIIRDNVNIENVKMRMDKQMKNDERVKYANIVINTIGNKDSVNLQVNHACNLLKERINICI